MNRQWFLILILGVVIIGSAMFVLLTYSTQDSLPVNDPLATVHSTQGIMPNPPLPEGFDPSQPVPGEDYAKVPGGTPQDLHMKKVKRQIISNDLGDVKNLSAQLKVRVETNGLVVVELDDRSLLVESGLKVGDRIPGVNGTPIKSLEDLSRAIRNAQNHNPPIVRIDRIDADGKMEPLYLKPL